MVVNYTQSDAPEGLEIKTDRNIFEKYEFNVENHKLKIRPKKEFRKHTNFRPTEFMVTANSRNLKKLAAAGSTHVNINSPLQAEEFEAGLAGSGIIQFHDTASFTNLKIEIAGSGDFVGHKVYCEELNGDDSLAIPLKESEKMQIGYIHRAGSVVSALGEIYIEELMKYQSAYAGKN